MAYLDVISLADAKNYLRIDDTLTEDNDQLTWMIESALAYLEGETRVFMFDRNMTYKMVDGSIRVYDFPINSVISPTKNVYATATATCASVIATDTIVVNGLTYTGVSGGISSYAEFNIGYTNAECAANIAASINGDNRTGTNGDVKATSSSAVVTITTNIEGFNGNAITIAETGGTITLSGSTFSGGLDGNLNEYKHTLYNTYCEGSDTIDLILNVGYTNASDVPEELRQVAFEILDILYYGKETGKTMADLSPLSLHSIIHHKRFIL